MLLPIFSFQLSSFLRRQGRPPAQLLRAPAPVRAGRFAPAAPAHALPFTPLVREQTLKLMLWGGSAGLFAVLLRRLFRRQTVDVSVGSVSEDWLAQHRGSGDTTPWS